MVRYKPSSFTKKELEIMVIALAADSGVDFLTGGKLNKYKRKAALAVFRTLSPYAKVTVSSATRGALGTIARLGGTAARVGFGAARTITMRHPYIAAAVVTYEIIKHRDQIAQLAQEGWQVIDQRIDTVGFPASPTAVPGMGSIEPFLLKTKTKKRPSKFNKAISAGMKALKRSKFMGKPGKFTSPKKAFGTVTRTVSRLLKGSKVSSKGALGAIKRAVRRYI
jgi:hypothetical protein